MHKTQKLLIQNLYWNTSKNKYGITEFIETSTKYAGDSLDGINIKELFNSAITGRIGNTHLFNNILNIFGREFKSIISTIRNSANYYYYT